VPRRENPFLHKAQKYKATDFPFLVIALSWQTRFGFGVKNYVAIEQEGTEETFVQF